MCGFDNSARCFGNSRAVATNGVRWLEVRFVLVGNKVCAVSTNFKGGKMKIHASLFPAQVSGLKTRTHAKYNQVNI